MKAKPLRRPSTSPTAEKRSTYQLSHHRQCIRDIQARHAHARPYPPSAPCGDRLEVFSWERARQIRQRKTYFLLFLFISSLRHFTILEVILSRYSALVGFLLP